MQSAYCFRLMPGSRPREPLEACSASQRRLKAEVLQRNSGAIAQVGQHRSRESLAFAHRRQFDKLRGTGGSTPQVKDSRSEFGDANRAFSVAVPSSASDEFSQGRHLGETRSQAVLGGIAWSGDAHLGRGNHDAVGFQYTELEHGSGKLQS